VAVVGRSVRKVSRIEGNKAPNENTKPNWNVARTNTTQKYNHFVLEKKIKILSRATAYFLISKDKHIRGTRASARKIILFTKFASLIQNSLLTLTVKSSNAIFYILLQFPQKYKILICHSD
jgi:hypothetical protein